MSTRSDLNSKYLGLHSCRYQAAKLLNNTLYHSQGTYISTLTLPSLKPTPLFKAHNSMISALILRPHTSPPSILTVDYYGCIAIHTFQGELLSSNTDSRQSIIPKSVRTASSNPSGSLLAILSMGGNPYNGTVEIYSVSHSEIKKITQLVGNFKQCEFVNETDLFVLRENIVDPGEVDVIRQMDRPISPEKVFDDFDEDQEEELDGEGLLKYYIYNSKRIVTYYALVFFDIAKQRVGKMAAIDVFERVNCMQQNHNGQVAFATIGRTVHVMDMLSLNLLHSLKLKGSGGLAMVLFLDNDLYFSPQSHYLCKFNTAQDSVKKEFAVDSSYSELFIVRTDQSWIHKNNFMCWVEKDRKLVSLNEYGIYFGTFVEFPNSGLMVDVAHEVIFKMTCCGLDICEGMSLVAVGDFSGKVVVFDFEADCVVGDTQVQGSVRSIVWHEGKVYIGTLDGLLYVWEVGREEADIFYSFSSTVVCMKWCLEVLAIGCTSGELHFMKDGNLIHQITAHETQEADERFGSLSLFSEIWSLTWSPDGSSLATGSEDQSVRIWTYSPWSLSHSLPKHSRAVTGVRWEKIAPITIENTVLDEIFVSCSDDETLRVYSPRTWTLLHVLKTSVIQEWHTVTYTSIQPNGKHIACVTQNGFVFILSLPDFSCTTIERIHNGSIEGLDWKGKLITCSSEGLCCVITMPLLN